MFKTKRQHMASDRPPVRGGLRKHFVLQVRLLVSPALKKMSYVGDISPRYVAATKNLSQEAGLVISY